MSESICDFVCRCMCTHLKIKFNNSDVGVFVCAHVCVIACALLDNHLFKVLLDMSSVADKAHLLSVSSPHAASWLSVTPSADLSLHLDPSQFQVAIKWWLGLDVSYCSLCPEIALYPLGHHTVTCKRGGDVVSRHSKLRDVLSESCRQAHLGVQVEMGSNVTPNHSHTRPADLLVPNWVLSKPAAFDLSVTSLLKPTIILEAIVTTGAAARTTEQRKHCSNDAKCDELLGSVYHWWWNHMELGERRLWSLSPS